MATSNDLPGLLARLLGWTSVQAISDARHSLELAATHQSHLVLCGNGDLVPIAHALHRRAFGPTRPFIVCDPRRGNTPATVRAPANHDTGAAAFSAARGGALCIRVRRVPRDFASIAQRLRSSDVVVLVICSDDPAASGPLLVRPAPIQLPPLEQLAVLTQRVAELTEPLGQNSHLPPSSDPPGAAGKRGGQRPKSIAPDGRIGRCEPGHRGRLEILLLLVDVLPDCLEAAVGLGGLCGGGLRDAVSEHLIDRVLQVRGQFLDPRDGERLLRLRIGPGGPDLPQSALRAAGACGSRALVGA